MQRSTKIFVSLWFYATMAAPVVAYSQQDPAGPCCAITEIRAGVITIKNNKTGTTFQLRLTKAEPASVLQVGQSVSFTAGNNTLLVHGRAGTAPQKFAVTQVKLNEKASSASPCCSVVAVDAAKGIVTARELATGYTFRFKAIKGALPAFKVGDAIAADFAAKTVRLKTADVAPCCTIIN
jgi:hypothetical protein